MTDRIIVIGASLSGIDALSRLLGRLPATFPAPIFVTQHIAAHSPGLLRQILSHAGKLPALSGWLHVMTGLVEPEPSARTDPGHESI
jgi:two-component system chemotaxis response regulator CheB